MVPSQSGLAGFVLKETYVEQRLGMHHKHTGSILIHTVLKNIPTVCVSITDSQPHTSFCRFTARHAATSKVKRQH